jgi:hypothetical protein
LRRDLEKTVGIDLEGGNKLCLSTRHRRNTGKLELAKQAVITALSALTLVSEGRAIRTTLRNR